VSEIEIDCKRHRVDCGEEIASESVMECNSFSRRG
jgi:hypothetical protein